MADAICVINAGICARTTKVSTTMSPDMMTAKIEIESDCPMVKSMGTIELNPYEIIEKPMTECEIYKKAAECIKHGACPVPCGIMKCMEAAAGLALKKPVSIEWEQ